MRGRDLRIPASVVVNGHRDANGRYEYFSAISRDISDQRANEAARRRSETALRAVVQSSPLADLRARRARHRARVEPRGRGAVRMVGGRCDRRPAAVHRVARRARRADRARVLGRDRAVRTRRATRGETATPLDVNVSIAPLRNACGSRRLGGRRGRRCDRSAAGRARRCARARCASARSCRTRATW